MLISPPSVPERPRRRWSLAALEQELVNTLTHGIGLALAVAGLLALVAYSVTRGGSRQVVGCVVFGVTLVILYGASTAYHSVRHARAKQILRTVDHVCIYLLIAGTYTPFTLTMLQDFWGPVLLAAVWILAASGAIFKIGWGHRSEVVSTGAYLGMGWLALIAAKPIWQGTPTGCIAWLLAGGVSYTLGVAFYWRDYLPYYHAVWHVFVLAGSSFHYCAVMLYVAPAAG